MIFIFFLETPIPMPKKKKKIVVILTILRAKLTFFLEENPDGKNAIIYFDIEGSYG